MVEQVQDLLPNPQILPHLLLALDDDDVNLVNIIDLLKVDPGLTAKIISMSNSPFYGFSDACSELSKAVERVGLDELFKLVSLSLCRSLGDKPVQNYYLDEGALWENAVTTAVIMEKMAEEFGISSELAYIVGLLHSMGKFVINRLDSDVYRAVYVVVNEDCLSLIDAEKKILGFDHAEACSALLDKWNYPDEVRLPIYYQYIPAQAKEYVELTYCLHLTKFLLASVGCSFGRDALAVNLDEQILAVLKIPEERLNLYALKAYEHLDKTKQLLKVMQQS